MYRIAGDEVVPFWSSRTRLERTVTDHGKYANFVITELSFAEFKGHLDQMASEGISDGVNGSGKRLVGYNVKVDALLASLGARGVADQ